MPYIQNASTTEYYDLSGIAYMSPGAIMWVSQVLYDNSAVIGAALIAGEIIDYLGVGAPISAVSARMGENVINYGAIGNGTTSDLDAINLAIAALSSLGDLYFPRGTYLIADNLTIPAGVGLVFADGAKIKIADTKTLTINGDVSRTGLSQIFEYAGSSSAVVLGNNSNKCVYPQWWGATADGSTDDGLAIRYAVGALKASGGGEIFFPSGTYAVSNINNTYISITQVNNISLKGNGPDTIIYNIDTIQDGGYYEKSVIRFNQCSRISISDLTIKGNPALQDWDTPANSYGSGDGIELYDCEDVIIDQCWFSSIGEESIFIYGDDAIESTRSRNICISNCIGWDCGYAYSGSTTGCSPLVNLSYCEKIVITNCHYRESFGHIFHIHNNVNEVAISNCTVSDAKHNSNGIEIKNAIGEDGDVSNIDISGIIIDDSPGHGIVVTGLATEGVVISDVNITNCHIISPGTDGIIVGSSGAADGIYTQGITIENCHIDSATGVGISLKDVKDFIIKSNRITNGAGHGILLNGNGLGAEVLDETDFATHVNWDVTGDVDDSGGNAAFVFAGGSLNGTLTQVAADMASAMANTQYYVLTYTVAVTSAPDGDFTLVLTSASGVSQRDISLPYTAGAKRVIFLASDTASTGDFIVTAAETTATQGSFTIDDISLKRITRCEDGVIAENIIKTHTETGKSGISINDTVNTAINGNIIQDTAISGIHIADVYTERISMVGNNMRNKTGAGYGIRKVEDYYGNHLIIGNMLVEYAAELSNFAENEGDLFQTVTDNDTLNKISET